MSSSRSFTVFVDQPARSAPKSSETLATLSTTTTVDALKENLHPVTGENSETVVKKRKGNVLATKSYIPPTAVSAAKKGKAPAVDGPAAQDTSKAVEPRKRAAASSQDGKLLAKKPRRLVSAGRVRTLKDLPKVEEEPEHESSAPKTTLAIEASSSKAIAAEAEGTSPEPQSTALSLDDLARALDQVSLEATSPVVAGQPVTSELSIIATNSIDTHRASNLSDTTLLSKSVVVSDPQPATPKAATFTFQVSTKKAFKKTNKRKKGKAAAKKGDAAFSTPERKLIYSAFTFSTPSPSSQRFVAASRPAGMEAPRFGDSKYSFGF